MAVKPWMTPAILQSINQKNKLFGEKLKDPSAYNVTKYNSFRNCLNKTIFNAKKLYYKEELSRHQHNPKKNWETLSKLLKQKDSKNCLPNKVVDDSGVDASDAKIMLEEFNKFFTEIGERLKQSIDKTNTDPLKYVENNTEQ